MPDSPVLDLGFARLDLGHEQRQGLAEVVYAPGKTREQITATVRGLLARNTGPVLVTRVEDGTAQAVRADVGTGITIPRRACWPGGPLPRANSLSRWSRPGPPTGRSPERHEPWPRRSACARGSSTMSASRA